MFLRERNRMRKNEKVHKLAEEVLHKCESEGFSMADLKDFAYVLQAMVDKTLLLNEQSHKLKHLHLVAEEFQNNNVDIRQQTLGNRHSQQE